MIQRENCLFVTFLILSTFTETAAEGAIVDYDASSGLPPQSVGWNFADQNNPPSSVGVGGGVLTLNSAVGNRAGWEFNPLPGTAGDQGAFIETTVRIVNEQHTALDRGAALPQIRYADGVIESGVDLYAWEDRIFLNDFNDVTVGTHFMDTTDQLHTYRVELLSNRFWVFVDESLVLTGTSPVDSSALNGIVGGFGDTSSFSGGVTEWARVRIGSLEDIGGPTVPEPSTLGLVGLGTAIIMFFTGRKSFFPRHYASDRL